MPKGIDAIKVSADENQVRFVCGHCGCEVRLEGEHTTRAFVRHLNHFRREHGWKCFYAARDRKMITDSKEQVRGLMARLAGKSDTT